MESRKNLLNFKSQNFDMNNWHQTDTCTAFLPKLFERTVFHQMCKFIKINIISAMPIKLQKKLVGLNNGSACEYQEVVLNMQWKVERWYLLC